LGRIFLNSILKEATLWRVEIQSGIGDFLCIARKCLPVLTGTCFFCVTVIMNSTVRRDALFDTRENPDVC